MENEKGSLGKYRYLLISFVLAFLLTTAAAVVTKNSNAKDFLGLPYWLSPIVSIIFVLIFKGVGSANRPLFPVFAGGAFVLSAILLVIGYSGSTWCLPIILGTVVYIIFE